MNIKEIKNLLDRLLLIEDNNLLISKALFRKKVFSIDLPIKNVSNYVYNIAFINGKSFTLRKINDRNISLIKEYVDLTEDNLINKIKSINNSKVLTSDLIFKLSQTYNIPNSILLKDLQDVFFINELYDSWNEENKYYFELVNLS